MCTPVSSGASCDMHVEVRVGCGKAAEAGAGCRYGSGVWAWGICGVTAGLAEEWGMGSTSHNWVSLTQKPMESLAANILGGLWWLC